MYSYVVECMLLAAYVAAAPAPAPQLPDFDLVLNAPTPSLLGPPPVGGSQTNVFDSSSAIAEASSDVTAVASASSIAIGTTKKRRDGLTESISQATATATAAPASTPQITTASLTGTTTTSASPSASTACTPEPDGYGPKNLSVNQFEHNPQFTLDALFAPTPAGYVNTFRNLNASVEANSYLGYYDLTSYDTHTCAKYCDDTTLCTAFDIYAERDPSVNPTAGVCPNPDAITNYKCALWGSGIDAAAATNYGQYRIDFHVVIAASNGYEKTNTTRPAACPGWNPPTHCGGAISAGGYFLGSQFFPGPFDPSICAAYAEAQMSYNRAHADSDGKYSPVNTFNAYMMKKNGIAQGTFCSLYSSLLDKSLGSYLGGWVGSDFFGIETSWMYSLMVMDKGHL
ncbi:MAG: hypothetical protein M1821_006088 [Bathelium mastoideum]|nr:MAG: hypothetical protein M1821_006088 [Bathelium mastoideum]